MKKSNTLYFISLTVSLIAYAGNIFNYLSLKNSSTISNSNKIQYIYLIIIIVMLPLFILSIWQMIKSIRNSHEVSTTSIVLLMINLVCMFVVYSFATISNFNALYEQYTMLIFTSSNLDMINKYIVIRANLFYSLIGGFVVPVTYLVTSILALVFKLQESRTEE